MTSKLVSFIKETARQKNLGSFDYLINLTSNEIYLSEEKKQKNKTENAVGGGDKSNLRGYLSEIGILNTINKYHDHYSNMIQKGQSHDDAHHGALSKLAEEGHISSSENRINNLHEHLHQKNSGKIQSAHELLGHKEADRTLWDSHHAGISLIHHIVSEHGPIVSHAHWTGTDTSGETVRKMTGHNTNADILIPTKNTDVVIAREPKEKGSKSSKWLGKSLKYYQDESSKPTKLFQTSIGRAISKIKGYASISDKQEKKLLDEQPIAKNSLSDDDQKMLKNILGHNPSSQNPSGITAKHFKAMSDSYRSLYGKNISERVRTGKRVGQLLKNQGIPEEKHNEHIKNMSEIYKKMKEGRGSKTSSFMQRFSDILNGHFNNPSVGNQNRVVRTLMNIPERKQGRNIKSIVVSVHRSSKKGKESDLPIVRVGNHSNDFDNLITQGRKNEPDANERNSWGTELSENGNHINLIHYPSSEDGTGKKVAKMSIDTSGAKAASLPQLMIHAGHDFESKIEIPHHSSIVDKKYT